MTALYTKYGRPSTVSGSSVFGPSGSEIDRVRRNKDFGPNGRYVDTITGDRLVHRPTNSDSLGSTFAPRSRVASARAGSAVWENEPDMG